MNNFLSALESCQINIFYINIWKKIKTLTTPLHSFNIFELVLLPSTTLNYAVWAIKEEELELSSSYMPG